MESHSRGQRRLLAGVAGVLLLLLVATTLPADAAHRATPAKRDPRTTQKLFVDKQMSAARHGSRYKSIGRKAQALWLLIESHPTSSVKKDVRAYTERALKAKRIPSVVVYSLPGRDCSQYSSGGAKSASAYRKWIDQVAAGLKTSKSLVVLEPDAIAHVITGRDCGGSSAWPALMRYATTKLVKAHAWVYLDAGHSGWTAPATMATALKAAGVARARGFSTNVSNFQPLAAEKAYATAVRDALTAIGVKGRHYVVDTSRSGNPTPVAGDVINPTWARIGPAPAMVRQGPFDARLWIKSPGESDGTYNGGGPAGQWCNLLADRLLGRATTATSC